MPDLTPARHTRADSRLLEHIRICDLTGQLAGAGATRLLASLGAQVIRVEDPVRQGTWDILRGTMPWVDGRRGIEAGGGFNNHNVEKLGVTINLRTDEGRELLRRLIAVSDVVSENFASGVMRRLGFTYDTMAAIKSDIIYVSNCGFGHDGPYETFKTWGPIVQANSGLTFLSALDDGAPAGWGYSYMDHMGANTMALAILAALVHKSFTGEGQWVDMGCVEAGATYLGPQTLDVTANGNLSRVPGRPPSNRNRYPAMAPHGIYQCAGDDRWVAIACRDDRDWAALAPLIDSSLATDERFAAFDGRFARHDELDQRISAWTSTRIDKSVEALVLAAGVPAAMVSHPRDRCDDDERTAAWGLWPEAYNSFMGWVRVDGNPMHFSEDDWSITQGAPCLGEDNDYVFGDVLGYGSDEIERLRSEGII
ncbi:MAG: CaiB/BaiF CoA transferase family protein [Acidimicrobiia bacterium]